MQLADDVDSTKTSKALLKVVSVCLNSGMTVLDHVQFDLDREHAQILNVNIICS